jgi:hypothetical protein
MRGFLRFLIGIELALAGLVGMAFTLRTYATSSIKILPTGEVVRSSIWPFLIIFSICFVAFVGGIYVTCRKQKNPDSKANY